MQRLWGRAVGWGCIAVLYLLLPFLPLVASVVFWRRQYLVCYLQSLHKISVHIHALRQGPAFHYFQDILGQVRDVPQAIQGECVQCGNCCMDHRCMFLVQLDHKRYQCGIYSSPLRRFSNCGSFPLNAYDIERYACPSYFVVDPLRPGTAVQHIAVADIGRAPMTR